MSPTTDVRFVLLNRLNAFARNSNLAPSPSTGNFGSPNALLRVASTSKYRGPRNKLRWIPGASGRLEQVCGNGNAQGVIADGSTKYDAAPFLKLAPCDKNVPFE